MAKLYRVVVDITRVYRREYEVEADDDEKAEELAQEEGSMDESCDCCTDESIDVISIEEI
jgi:hypothetical protein